jgi:hypothetical protein
VKERRGLHWFAISLLMKVAAVGLGAKQVLAGVDDLMELSTKRPQGVFPLPIVYWVDVNIILEAIPLMGLLWSVSQIYEGFHRERPFADNLGAALRRSGFFLALAGALGFIHVDAQARFHAGLNIQSVAFCLIGFSFFLISAKLKHLRSEWISFV